MTYTIDHLRPIIDRVRTDITALKMPDGAIIWRRDQPLTTERIETHLSGKYLRGVCPIKEGESTTRLALFDLDSHKDEVPWDEMQAVAQKIYDEGAALGVYFDAFKSSGGNGVHMFAVWDEPQDAYSVRELMLTILMVCGFDAGTEGVAKKQIEIFPKQNSVPIGGCGNQFILPYSPKGVPLGEVEWRPSEPVPKIDKPIHKSLSSYTPDESGNETIDDVAYALSFITDDSYHAWVEIGMALKQHLGEAGFNLWDTWSARSPKYQNAAMRRKWNSFNRQDITIRTLYHRAKMEGWRKFTPEQHRQKATPIVDQMLAKMTEDKAPVVPDVNPSSIHNDKHFDPKYPMGFDVLAMPGLIGDTVREIVKYSLYPQPELAYLNVLAAAGAMFGRTYESPIMSGRTNVYFVGIANSTDGKDFSRTYVSELFEAIGATDFIGPNHIRSDKAILDELMANPAMLCMIDEFGMFLEAVTNPRASSHLKAISSILTKIFTCSSTQYNHGTVGGDSRTSIKIQNPALSLYCTTTEKKYAQVLSMATVESGELNRFMMFKSGRTFTGNEPYPPKMVIDPVVRDAWSAICPSPMTRVMKNLGGIRTEPIRVQLSDKAYELLDKCRIEMMKVKNSGSDFAPLWGRYHEYCIKVAMILAIVENPHEPIIGPGHARYAISTITACVRYSVKLCKTQMASSEYEQKQNLLVDYLKKSRKEYVTMTEINRALRSIKAKDRTDMLADMHEQGIIEIEKLSSNRTGRAATAVRLVVHDDVDVDEKAGAS